MPQKFYTYHDINVNEIKSTIVSIKDISILKIRV